MEHTFSTQPRKGMHTPWGAADTVTEVAAGIVAITTSSHGGYLLSAERRAAMPAALQAFQTYAGGNWYEEDCDWSLVALAFPEHFQTGEICGAVRTALAWQKLTPEDIPEAALAKTRRFVVGSNPDSCDLATLLAINIEDEAVCEWATHAQVGDIYPDGTGRRCIDGAAA